VADETGRRLDLVEHDLRGLSLAQRVGAYRMLGNSVRRQIRRGSQIGTCSASTRQMCNGACAEAAGPNLVRSVNDIALLPPGPGRGGGAQLGSGRDQPDGRC
jgi:hypothetical protein